MDSKHSNSEEYDNPALYDQENEMYIEDLPFLMKWASITKGTIIDIACGTGRVTIPLASKGYNLIGVDLHKGMLEEARKKSSVQNIPIDWIEQDCTQLELNLTSRLIYSVGNSFQHFLTNKEQDGLLSSVNKHLEIGGIFVFNTRFPSMEELFQPSTEEYWRTYIDSEAHNKVDVSTICHYDSLNQLQYYTTIRRFKDDNGEVIKEVRTNITLRYVFPKEMERLLFQHGFQILNVYEDWNETPVTNNSYAMIYVCEKVR